MSITDNPSGSRSFSGIDAKRAFISVAILTVICTCYWFLLPAIQSLIIPSAHGGNNGPWVVRPIFAFHFGAVAVMAAVTMPLITWPLRNAWKRHDAALGTQYIPFQNQPTKRGLFFVWGCLLLVVYASALLFYLLSWDRIGLEEIEQHLPWATVKHSYQDIAMLEMIPNGKWSDSVKKEGPWYSIVLRNGQTISLSDDNEGTTSDDLRAMTAYIANRSGLSWIQKSDVRKR